MLGSEDQGQLPFDDLGALIVAYSRNKGCLPACLNLDSFNSVFEEDDDDRKDGSGGESFVDPDYQTMAALITS